MKKIRTILSVPMVCLICATVLALTSSALAQVLTAVANVSTNQESSSDENEKLESYLQNLKLDRLLIEHLENQIEIERDADRRRGIAKRLIGLYADDLLKPQLDPDITTRWINKADRMLKLYPEHRGPRVKIAMLQARYQSEEREFRQWWTSGSQPREKLIERWQNLLRELIQFNANMEARYQELVAAIQANSGDVQLASELSQTENLLLHSSFLVGWSAYFRGILQLEESAEFLELADKHFRDFLQIESRKSLNEFSAKWFDFGSVWQTRAVVGLAMVHRGLNHPQQSEHCFRLIREYGSFQSNEVLEVWRLNSRLYVGEDEAAVDCIKEFQQRFHETNNRQIRFWITALRASVVIESRSPKSASTMRRDALAGLTRTSQALLIEEFIAEHDHTFDDDFLGNWVRGYLEFYQSETTGQPSRLEAAKRLLQRAVETTDARISPTDVARCRYLLGRIHFRSRAFEEAASMFQSVSAVMIELDPGLAAESQWLAAKSLIELSRSDSRKSELAYAAIDTLIRKFPETGFARLAEFEKLRLNVASLPGDEAIRRLNRIKPSDPNFGFALEEITRTRFRLWLKSLEADQSDHDQRLQQLVESEKATRQHAAISDESKLKTSLLVVDAWLRYSPLNEVKANEALAISGVLSKKIGNQASLAYAEYQYYQLLFAERSGDEQTALTHARWLSEHSSKTRFERSALIYLGRALQNQLSLEFDATGSILNNVDPNLLAETLDVFRRLTELLGNTQTDLKKSNNAHAAMTQMAQLEFASQNFETAENIYAILNASFPNRQNHILGLAQTRMKLKKFDSAMPLWRKLNAGVSAGTDLWYESKYQMIVCVLPSNKESAGQILRQTLRLSPEMSQQWQARFDELKDKLE